MSIEVAFDNNCVLTCEELLDTADAQLYAVKAARHNAFSVSVT